MADTEADEDLFADLYDGDDTADAAPTATEPEPQAPQPEAAAHEPEPEPVQEPVIAVGSANAGVPAAEPSYSQSYNMESMDGVQRAHDGFDSRPEERPIGIKEDGRKDARVSRQLSDHRLVEFDILAVIADIMEEATAIADVRGKATSSPPKIRVLEQED